MSWSSFPSSDSLVTSPSSEFKLRFSSPLCEHATVEGSDSEAHMAPKRLWWSPGSPEQGFASPQPEVSSPHIDDYPYRVRAWSLDSCEYPQQCPSPLNRKPSRTLSPPRRRRPSVVNGLRKPSTWMASSQLRSVKSLLTTSKTWSDSAEQPPTPPAFISKEVERTALIRRRTSRNNAASFANITHAVTDEVQLANSTPCASQRSTVTPDYSSRWSPWTWRSSSSSSGASPPRSESSPVPSASTQTRWSTWNWRPAASATENPTQPDPNSCDSKKDNDDYQTWWSWVRGQKAANGGVHGVTTTPTPRFTPNTTSSSWRKVIGSMEWLYADATQIVDNMIPSGRELFQQQELEWADILQAGAKVSDLSVYLSEMPTFFWIFIIALVYNMVHVAHALMEIWIDALIHHFGIIAHCCCFAIVFMTWPVFIWYLVQTFTYAREVNAWHQRIVQILGVPASICTEPLMTVFCTNQKLDVAKVIIPPAAERDNCASNDTCTVELVFKSIADLQGAFKREALTPHLKMQDHWVRARPKIGTNTAVVEWWLVSFEYLNENVPERYWLRATFSCLITMSLTKHAAAGVVWLYCAFENGLGIFGEIVTKLLMLMSLISLFFFVGHHAFEEICDAHREMRHETREHRLAGEPKS